MFCPRCGAAREEHLKYCPSCGATLGEALGTISEAPVHRPEEILEGEAEQLPAPGDVKLGKPLFERETNVSVGRRAVKYIGVLLMALGLVVTVPAVALGNLPLILPGLIMMGVGIYLLLTGR